MKKQSTRLLSLLLVLLFALALLPTSVLATGEVNVAKIGDVKYPTLAAAVSSATAEDTVTLLATTSGDGIIIDKSLTLDLGGHTYTVTGNLVGSANTVNQGFQILAGNTVTIQNGTLATGTACIGKQSGVEYTGNAKMLIQNYAALTLDGVTLDGANVTHYVVSNNDNDISVKNSTINAPVLGCVAIDAAIWGTYAGAVVTLENTTVNGDLEVAEWQKVNGVWEKQVGFAQNNGRPAMIIKSGTFTDLADALLCAEDGATIKLGANASGDGIIIDKSLTLDLGGYTYTVTGNLVGSLGTENQGFQISTGDAVTIKNGTLATGTVCVGDVTDGKAKMLIQNYAALTLDGVTLDGANVTRYVVSNNDNDISVKNSTINAPVSGCIAIDAAIWGTYAGAVVTLENTTVNGDLEVAEWQNVNGVWEKQVGFAQNNGRPAMIIKSGTFTDLADALLCAEDGATIKLGADVTSPDKAVCYHIDKAITLDLNGHELSGLANGSCPVATHFIRIENGGVLTVDDTSAAQTGVISATYKASSPLLLVEIMADSKLILNGGSITNGNDVNYSCVDVYLQKNAAFEMNGGTIAAVNNPNKSMRERALFLNAATSIATINGGTITSDSSDYIVADKGLTITGGYFDNLTVLKYLAANGTYNLTGDGAISADVTIPAGATLNISADSTVTVKSGYTLTIPEGATVVNNGTIANAGTIVNSGTFTNNGTLNGNAVTGAVAGTASEIAAVADVASKEDATSEEVVAAVATVAELPNEALNDDATLTKLAALEAKYLTNDNVIETVVVPPTSTPITEVAVDNAALSVPVDVAEPTAAKVTVTPVAAPVEEGKTPAEIVSAAFGDGAVEDGATIIPLKIELTIGESTETVQPSAPLVFKFKVDMSKADAAKLVVVHYKENGDTEILRPIVSVEDAAVYVQFTTTSLSTFVLVSTSDVVNNNAYEIIFTPDKLNASAGQEVTYTVSIKQTAGAEAITMLNLGLIYNNTVLTNPVFTKDAALADLPFDFGAIAEAAGSRPAGTYTLDLNAQSGWDISNGNEVTIGTLKFTVANAGANFISLADFQIDELSAVQNGDNYDPAALNITTADTLSYQYVTVKLGATTYYVPYGTNILYADMATLVANAPAFTTGASEVPTPAASANYRLTDATNWYLADKTTTFASFTGFTSSKTFYVKQAYLRTVTLVDAFEKFTVGSGFDGDAESGYKIANDQDAVFTLAATPTNYKLDSVTYKVGSAEPVALEIVEGNYTIPMAAITGNTTITITYVVNLAAEDIGVFYADGAFKAFSAYSGTKTLVLINAPGLTGVTMSSGEPVYSTDGYTGYTHAVLVDMTGVADAAALKTSVISRIVPADSANEALTYDYNTNGKAGPLVTDVQAAYDFFSRQTIRWNPADKLLLIADVLTFAGGAEDSVNARANYTAARDGQLTGADINAFLYAYAQFRATI